MKRIPLLITFLCLFLKVYGQKDFRPGYIITLPGDTIKGEINFMSLRKNTQGCEFRKAGTKEKSIYSPGEILGYSFENGPRFRSYSLPAKAGQTYKNITPKQFYFLNILVEAPTSLFMTYDVSGRSRFFIQQDTIIKE